MMAWKVIAALLLLTESNAKVQPDGWCPIVSLMAIGGPGCVSFVVVTDH